MAARVRAAPNQRDSRRSAGWLERIAPLVLALAAGLETLRLGFFADDFHFLDVARRVPLLEALNGRYGVFPWYRPLSRELYFALVAAAGPAALVVARGLSLAALLGCIVLIARLGRVLAGERAARIGAALFATYAITRFLVAWASGFQDLLAVLLMLASLEARARDRFGLALLWAALAPFAKETAVVVFPLLALWEWRVDAAGRVRRLLAIAGTFVAVAFAHLAVRAAWHGHGGSNATIAFQPPALGAALLRVATGFVGALPVATWASVSLAVLGAVALAVWLAPARDARDRDERGAGGTTFLAVAAALGIAPLVLGQLLGFTSAHAYYAFAAAPYLALLLGRALATLPETGHALAVVLVFWNLLALGWRAPDLSSPDSWSFRRWDWPEAERLDAVSKRLSTDLRTLLPVRPESLVVLYRLPEGSFFQTLDGPAVREALHDRTVRAYYINNPPYPLTPGRYRMLEFDTNAFHLVHKDMPRRDRAPLAARALVMGDDAAAWAFASLRDSSERLSFDQGYLAASAALMEEGPRGWRRELAAEGLADSSATAAGRTAAEAMQASPALEAPLAVVLQHPCDAAGHVAWADALERAGARYSAAVELRVATALDPALVDQRLRLARLLVAIGQPEPARVELTRLAADVRGTSREADVRGALAELPATH